jgi:hypothetical protein
MVEVERRDVLIGGAALAEARSAKADGPRIAPPT